MDNSSNPDNANQHPSSSSNVERGSLLVQKEKNPKLDTLSCNVCRVEFAGGDNNFADLLLHFNNFHPDVLRQSESILNGVKPPQSSDGDKPKSDEKKEPIDKEDKEPHFGYNPTPAVSDKPLTSLYDVPDGLRTYLLRRALTSVDVLVKPYKCIECGHLLTNLRSSLRHLCIFHNFVNRGSVVWARACVKAGFAKEAEKLAAASAVGSTPAVPSTSVASTASMAPATSVTPITSVALATSVAPITFVGPVTFLAPTTSVAPEPAPKPRKRKTARKTIQPYPRSMGHDQQEIRTKTSINSSDDSRLVVVRSSMPGAGEDANDGTRHAAAAIQLKFRLSTASSGDAAPQVFEMGPPVIIPRSAADDKNAGDDQIRATVERCGASSGGGGKVADCRVVSSVVKEDFRQHQTSALPPPQKRFTARKTVR